MVKLLIIFKQLENWKKNLFWFVNNYSGNSHKDHLHKVTTSLLRPPWASPKCGLNRAVLLYIQNLNIHTFRIFFKIILLENILHISSTSVYIKDNKTIIYVRDRTVLISLNLTFIGTSKSIFLKIAKRIYLLPSTFSNKFCNEISCTGY